jgi:hypothetical protein
MHSDRADEVRSCVEILRRIGGAPVELEVASVLLERIAAAPTAYVSALETADHGAALWVDLTAQGHAVIARALDGSREALATGDREAARAIDAAGLRIVAALQTLSSANVRGLKGGA